MCGLVGVYSSNMMNKHREVLAAMLYLDTWRGRDSTGVAAIRHNADTSVLKATIPGYEFVEGPKLEQHLKLNDFCWIGHNRYGTMGKNIKTNAHPFTIDDDDGACLLVGAHNGTLKNKHVLMDHVKFGTDSEALFHNIAHEGIEATIPKIEGAWALTYYDHIEEELRIIRNKERPLFFAYEEGKKTLFWASEMWMIRIATSRYDIKLHEDKCWGFLEDTLYRFPAPEKMNDELKMEKTGGLVGKETPAFFQGWARERWAGGKSSSNVGPHSQTNQERKPTHQTSSATAQVTSSTPSGSTTNNNGEKQTTKNESSSSDPSKVKDILSAKKFKGYAGVMLSKGELEAKLENGCGWCELEFITPDERFAWLAPDKPICHKCLDGEEEPSKEEKIAMAKAKAIMAGIETMH